MLEKNHVFSGKDDEDIKVFEALYDLYYSSLCSLAESFIKDQDRSEAIVSDVFLEVWENRMDPEVYNSLKKSLYRVLLGEVIKISKGERVNEKQVNGDFVELLADTPVNL